MTEKVRLLRPSVFADRAELFYSDINGKSVSVTVDKALLDGSFHLPFQKGCSAELRAGSALSQKSEIYMAECLVYGGENFLDFRKKLIEKEQKVNEYGLNLRICCQIPIRIFEKGPNGIKLFENLFAHAPIVNSQIQAFVSSLCFQCTMAGVIIQSYYVDEDGLISFGVSGSFCEIADKIVIFKVVAKRLSEKLGLAVTFMAKPFFDKRGAGLGLKIEIEGEKRHNFFEGVLLHLPESLCMISTTVNSFARLKERAGYLCHGKGEEVLFRTEEKGEFFAFEFDLGDLLGNTYIAFCALIESGIMGIIQNLTLRDSVYEVTPSLQKETGRIPFSLSEALEIGWASGFISNALGECASRLYFAEKKKECESLSVASGEGEHRARYFDLY